ncbi:hypothetical protein CIPAW_11G131700 [Carya illinoinensis]|uniref:Uncharacterized protein n=1 Tax=Carya illinoinensis TaxID=32201 RepID=A0A8T1NWW9_CARIL|nr:hypothetical protein CIPAW_11G131700 [Carya illinoinensis]
MELETTSLSDIFSFCYRWDRLRSLRESFSRDQDHDADQDIEAASHPNPNPHARFFFLFEDLSFQKFEDLKHNQSQILPVLMPGDQIPKFIALSCPCKPPRPDHEKAVVAVNVQKPSKPLPRQYRYISQKDTALS